MPIGTFKINTLGRVLAVVREYIATMLTGEVYISNDAGTFNGNLGQRWPWPSMATSTTLSSYNAPAYSPDGQYFAQSTTTSPYIVFFKKVAGVWTRIATGTVTTGLTATARTVNWSPDGNYVLALSTGSPGFVIFKKTGDTFALITVPSIPVAGLASSWTSDSNSIAIATQSTTIYVFNRVGDVFTAVATPPTISYSFGVKSVAWNPAGTSLAATSDVSPYLYIYNRSGNTFTRVADPVGVPTIGYTQNSVAWNNNGSKLAYSALNLNAIYVYNRVGDVFTKITTGPVIGTASPYQLKFSSDGTKLAGISSGSLPFDWWSVSGDTFTKLSSPTTGWSGGPSGFDWSTDNLSILITSSTIPGIYEFAVSGTTLINNNLGRSNPVLPDNASTITLAIVKLSNQGNFLFQGFGVTPAFSILSRIGNIFTKLANPAIMPGNANYAGSWMYDDTKLATANLSSPLIIYNRNGNIFTKVADPAIMPPGFGWTAAWNPDGTVLIVGSSGTPYLNIYNRVGDTYTKVANPAILPSGQVLAVGWSPDGKVLIVGTTVGSKINIYNRSGDIYTRVADPTQLPWNFTSGLSDYINWSPNSQYVNVNYTLYQRSGDTYTIAPTNPLLSAGNVQWIDNNNFYNYNTTQFMKYTLTAGTFIGKAITVDYPVSNSVAPAISYFKG